MMSWQLNFDREIMKVIIGIFFFINSLQAFSQLPLITDNTGTQGKGNGQIEISNGIGYLNEHRCIESSSEISPVFTYGIVDDIDFVVGYPFLFSTVYGDSMASKTAGFSDLSVEFKYNFLKYRNLSLAVKPGMTLPTGNFNEGQGSGKFSETCFIISTFELPKLFVNTNLGYLRNENKCGDALNIWHASVDADYELGENFRAVINTGIEKNPDKNDKKCPMFGLIGMYYCINSQCEISLGYRNDFNASQQSHAFIYGLTVRF